MITIRFEERFGEYKYKVAYIMDKDYILDSFRIDRRLATEDRLRAHPLYGIRIKVFEDGLRRRVNTF